MITVTFQQMQNFNQNPALMQKLINTPMNAKLSYDIKKVLDGIGLFYKDAITKFNATRTEIQKKHCVVDEKGELVEDAVKKEFTIKDGAEPALNEEMGKLLMETNKQSFTIDRELIAISRLQTSPNLHLSVADWSALEPLIADIPEQASQPTDNVAPIRG